MARQLLTVMFSILVTLTLWDTASAFSLIPHPIHPLPIGPIAHVAPIVPLAPIAPILPMAPFPPLPPPAIVKRRPSLTIFPPVTGAQLKLARLGLDSVQGPINPISPIGPIGPIGPVISGVDNIDGLLGLAGGSIILDADNVALPGPVLGGRKRLFYDTPDVDFNGVGGVSISY